MVSVIIPVYNVEKYLNECVDSVLEQTYKDLEIILIDDGSTDQSGLICDGYMDIDNRVKVIHKKNGGLSDARNAGFSISRGKYVYFLDSDDFIKPYAIEVLVNKMEDNNADFIFFDAETIYDNFDDSQYKEDFVRRHCYHTDQGSLIFQELIENKEYYSCVPLLFFRKSFIEKNQLKFIEGIMHEDELYTAVAFVRAERITQLNESIYVRRLRSGSIMSNKVSEKSITGLIVCIEGFFRERERHGKNSTAYQVISNYIVTKIEAIFDEYVLLDQVKMKMLKPKITELKKRISCEKYFGNIKIWMRFNLLIIYVFYKRVKKQCHIDKGYFFAKH